MRFDSKAPEYLTVEALVQYLLDDDRISFFPGEAQAVSIATKTPIADVMTELVSYGFKSTTLAVQNITRGFNSNPNGTHPFQENPTFTTSGSNSIIGFAGTEGY